MGVSFGCTEVAGATSCSAALGQAILLSGGIGEWALIATNLTAASVAGNADILAVPLPGRTFDLVVASLSGSEVIYPNPILLAATISQGIPITGVNVSATITDPMGDARPLTLVDTGQDGEGIAKDGTYSAIVDYASNGIHTIKVMVDNATQKPLAGQVTLAIFDGEGRVSAAKDFGLADPQRPFEVPPGLVRWPIAQKKFDWLNWFR